MMRNSLCQKKLEINLVSRIADCTRFVSHHRICQSLRRKIFDIGREN